MIKLKLRILLNNILIGLLLFFHLPSFLIFIIIGTVHVFKQKDPDKIYELKNMNLEEKEKYVKEELNAPPVWVATIIDALIWTLIIKLLLF
ncbi:MAG TPA: hypothetical protein PK289_01210 [Bacteroidia bacterium]|nr:hypothetical protein [Bacteroidia bacterium]